MTQLDANALKVQFTKLDAAFGARAPRERILLTLGFLALVVYLVDAVAVRPLEEARTRTTSQTTTRRDTIANLEQRIEAARNPSLDAANDPEQAEIRRLEEQVARIDAELRTTVERLVPPESAVEILESLLAGDERLELVRLASTPPRRLGLDADEGGRTLYQHGITIEVEGDFAAALAYLRRIESSPWQLLWDRLEYRVERFPEAHVTIELHTLSEQEEWVGV